MENSYPFVTKKQVKANIAGGSPQAITLYAYLMQERTDRRDANPTLKRCGWMSSHERRGREVGQAAQALIHEYQAENPGLPAEACSVALSGETLALATKLVASYDKQIAAELRSRAIREDASLNETAAVFGVSE